MMPENIYDVPKNKPDSPVILDLGCYLGYESKKLLDIYNPSLLISVDAIEESVATVASKARHYDQWRTECCIVGNVLGKSKIGVHRSWAMEDNYCAHCDGIENLRELPTKRIKDIHPNPDIIKCDIESGEYHVWPQFLALPSLKILFLEVHGRDDSAHIYYTMTKRLKEEFNLIFFELNQGQTVEIDYARRIDERDFVCVSGNYCQVLAERKT